MATAQAKCMYDGTDNSFSLRVQTEPVESYLFVCSSCGYKNCVMSEADGSIVTVFLCQSNFDS